MLWSCCSDLDPNLLLMQVCERLGPSLYDFLRKNNYRPFSVDLVRDFGRQLLESVACEHSLCFADISLLLTSRVLSFSSKIKLVVNEFICCWLQTCMSLPSSTPIWSPKISCWFLLSMWKCQITRFAEHFPLRYFSVCTFCIQQMYAN